MSTASHTNTVTRNNARFVTGSTMRHVIIMTVTGAIGLMAMFLVDFADLFFLALLGDTAITAAVGFAGTVAFINLSISLGLGIAGAALVARSIGAGNDEAARRYATNALACTILAGFLVALCVWVFATPLLELLGASGKALELGRLYLRTLTPGFALLSAAISLSFTLRAIGDPTRAMYVTLAAAIGNAILDPLFIFGLDMGIQGAALASICANLMSFMIGFYGIQSRHSYLTRFSIIGCAGDLKAIFSIALPAILTQLATPFAIAYLTRATAEFGDEAVSAAAIINRLVPVAFGVVFSLSGAVGPIIGQNYGANLFPRVRRSLLDALLFSTCYTVATSFVLFLLRDHIPGWFLAADKTAELVTFFCTWLAVSWAFAGAQFVAQAAFNNLGKPVWSTICNWGKATIGTIPFVHIGAQMDGARGILIGSALGSVIFGIAAAIIALWLVNYLARCAQQEES